MNGFHLYAAVYLYSSLGCFSQDKPLFGFAALVGFIMTAYLAEKDKVKK